MRGRLQDEALEHVLASLEVVGELDLVDEIVRAAAGGVDEHDGLTRESREQRVELEGRAGDVAAGADDLGVGAELLDGGDAVGVERDELDAAALLERDAGGELGDRRGLSDAGRSDERDGRRRAGRTGREADGVLGEAHHRGDRGREAGVGELRDRAARAQQARIHGANGATGERGRKAGLGQLQIHLVVRRVEELGVGLEHGARIGRLGARRAGRERGERELHLAKLGAEPVHLAGCGRRDGRGRGCAGRSSDDGAVDRGDVGAVVDDAGRGLGKLDADRRLERADRRGNDRRGLGAGGECGEGRRRAAKARGLSRGGRLGRREARKRGLGVRKAKLAGAADLGRRGRGTRGDSDLDELLRPEAEEAARGEATGLEDQRLLAELLLDERERVTHRLGPESFDVDGFGHTSPFQSGTPIVCNLALCGPCSRVS